MRVARVLPLLVAGFGAVMAARCNGGGGGDLGETPPCEIDLSPYVGSGSGASAKFASAAELIAGPAAQGRAGDVLLRNGRIQVVIEQANRSIGPQPYGGNIIDADIVRDGEPARDNFGELGALYHFGRTVAVDKVEILRDGSAGGAAIVAATGRDAELDFINLPGLVSTYMPGLPLPDVDRDLKLRVTMYYVLPPDSNAVKVIHAICSDNDEELVFGVGDLANSGGEVHLFSGGRGRFGGGDINPSNAVDAILGGDGTADPFIAWVNDDVTYGYVAPTDMNQVLTISGVTATLLGGESVVEWIGDNIAPPAGAMILEPGEQKTVERDFVVSRDLSAVYDHFYGLRGTATGVVKGRVLLPSGQPVAGARVAAVRDDRAVNAFITDADGRFSGRVPAGAIDLIADDQGIRSGRVAAQVAANGETETDVTLPGRGRVEVTIRDASGQPVPGKVTVGCQGTCSPHRSGDESMFFSDARLDSMPSSVFEYRYVGPEAATSIDLPTGTYTVFVSRGPEWSLFSEEVTVTDGGQVPVQARIAHVVDTTGWMSGDFHVHSIGSPDSIVPNVERLKTFMAEGVDVIVATDHDVITDFEPFLAQIPDGAKFIRTITGVETTTFDYGHYNAFPLVRDPEARNGGALDWAGGGGPGLPPKEIFEALHAFPGEQVVQLNHARSGFISMLQIDTRTMWSRADPRNHRIRPIAADPNTGDTRLFDDGFTALEIQNGFGRPNFLGLMNDWFALLSRGFKKTGTAVSDTHKVHGTSGHPRSWVRVGVDTPEELDIQDFARAVNAQKLVGSSGPFVVLTAQAGGEKVEIGETLVSNGQPVTVHVEVRTPDWMEVDSLALYMNSTGTAWAPNRGYPRELPAPVATSDFTRTEVEVDGGFKAYRFEATVELNPEEDAWLVALVEGPTDMFPVVGKGGTRPLAFTNPLFIDVDGNGWTPPIDLAEERTRIGSIGSPLRQAMQRQPTEAEVRKLFAGPCDHGDEHDHDDHDGHDH